MVTETYPFQVLSGEESYEAKAIIIATGATAKRLRVPGENKFRERGISACAICDGSLPHFRDQTLVVIGGGNTACSEALYLSRFGKEVIMLVRKDHLRAGKILQDKVLQHEKIKILWNTEITECLGETSLSSIKIKNNLSDEESILEAKGVFYAIGYQPNTAFVQDILETTEDGFLVTESGGVKTKIPGIFAAGDVQDRKYRQAVTAAGTGASAAIEVENFLA